MRARTRGHIEIKDAIAQDHRRGPVLRGSRPMRYGDLQGITLEKSDQSFAGPRSEEVGFAHDPALEGDGFELSVPPLTSKQFRRGAFARRERLSKSRAPL